MPHMFRAHSKVYRCQDVSGVEAGEQPPEADAPGGVDSLHEISAPVEREVIHRPRVPALGRLMAKRDLDLVPAPEKG